MQIGGEITSTIDDETHASAADDKTQVRAINTFIGSITADTREEVGSEPDLVIDVASGAPVATDFTRSVSVATQADLESTDDDQLRIGRDPGEGNRAKAVQSAHELIHGGLRATLDELRIRGYTWKGMSTEALAHIRACNTCVRNNIRAQGYHEPKGRVAVRPGNEFTMDLFSMPPGSDGYDTALIMVDSFSRFTIIEPLLDKRAATVAAAQWRVFSRIGIPDLVGSDQGPEFNSELAKSFATLLGHEHYFVVPRHPEGNSFAESGVRRARRALNKVTEAGPAGDVGIGWAPLAPQIEFGLNRAVSQATNLRPAEVFLGRRLARAETVSDIPRLTSDDETGLSEAQIARVNAAVELVLPELLDDLQHRADANKQRFAKTHKIIEPLSVGDVVVSERQQPSGNGKSQYTGPYTVARVTRNNNYVLRNQMGREIARRFPVARLRLVQRAAVPDIAGRKNDNAADAVDDEEFEIERVVMHLAPETAGGPLRYVVRWKGYDSDDDTIVPADQTTNCVDAVSAYWRIADKQ